MSDLQGVDGIIVINLDRRPDRWATFQRDWDDRLPWDRVVRLSASDGQQVQGFGSRPWFRGRNRDRAWAGRAGCALSHARAMREAQARGWARVLVFEDDAVPAAYTGLPAALQDRDWDILYLGGSEVQGLRPAHTPGVAAIHGVLDLHAYAVTEAVRDFLAQSLPDEATIWNWIAREGAVDRWMRREIGQKFRVMICWPIYATQGSGTSDITQQARPDYRADDALTIGESSLLVRTVERTRNGAQWLRRRAIGF